MHRQLTGEVSPAAWRLREEKDETRREGRAGGQVGRRREKERTGSAGWNTNQSGSVSAARRLPPLQKTRHRQTLRSSLCTPLLS